jgi:hypothetical protein
MSAGRGKNFLQRLFEGVIAIALVLFFFAILIMIFNFIFPEGSGLHFLFDKVTDAQRQADRRESELKVAQGNRDSLLIGDDDWAATLVETRNSVKSKKAADIAWQRAKKGMPLGNRDAVQTLESSSAVIKFDARNYIDLGENSLIVIRRLERDLLFKEKRSFMVVVDGELRGRIGGGDQSDVYLEIETPNAVARLKSDPADQEGIEFKVDVLEESSSAVTIYSGEGEVEAQGETVLLGKNQLTRIVGELAPTAPVTLPAPADMLTPPDRGVFPYRSLPPRISMSWQKQAGTRKYHFILAEDRDFTRILVDKTMTNTAFIHGNLREGDYYWKISSINRAGEGPFSPVRQFTLKQDQLPPALTVNFPPEIIEQPDVVISGESEPGTELYISGQSAVIGADGRFQHKLQLPPGINIVVVEAIDRAGNVSYKSQLINGKY